MVALRKEYNLSRHYTGKHLKFRNIEGQEREDKIKLLLKSVRWQQAVFQKVVSNNEGVVGASFAMAETYAANSKPFMDGKYLKTAEKMFVQEASKASKDWSVTQDNHYKGGGACGQQKKQFKRKTT